VFKGEIKAMATNITKEDKKISFDNGFANYT
jgi:hypothetical protein